MIYEVFENMGYFLALSLKTELLWIIFPLALATIVMLVYFSKYKGERPGWNSYVSNSLVLLFVSVILLRQIYSIDRMGALNFIAYPWKTGFSAGVLLIGIIILFLNFERYLPERVAAHVSSPLTLNLVAYVIILFVFSGLPLNSLHGTGLVQSKIPFDSGGIVFLSLLVLFVLLIIVLNGLLILFNIAFEELRKMKQKEVVENVLGEKKKIEDEKRDIMKREAKLEKDTLSKAALQKKEAERLKKVLRKRRKR
jgi:hypothetical protein